MKKGSEVAKTEQEIQRDELRRRMVEKLKQPGLTRESGKPGKFPSTSCLLLDRSGSMAMRVGDKSMRSSRIQELRKLAEMFPGVRKFQYDHEVSELWEGEMIADARGDNDEPLAFEYVKKHGIRHVVLLSDGGADNPRKALEAAKGLKVDVCYIGPEPMPQFLVDLANQSGGTAQKGNLTMLKELESKVRERLLIEAPPWEESIKL